MFKKPKVFVIDRGNLGKYFGLNLYTGLETTVFTDHLKALQNGTMARWADELSAVVVGQVSHPDVVKYCRSVKNKVRTDGVPVVLVGQNDSELSEEDKKYGGIDHYIPSRNPEDAARLILEYINSRKSS